MKKILFIDDEIETFSFAYYDHLLSIGHEVVSVKSASEAIQKFESEDFNSFELIILDNIMPVGKGNAIKINDVDFGKKSGVFLYEKIKEKNSSIPIIFLSVVLYETLQQRYGFDLDFEADRYLVKGQTTIVDLENEILNLTY